MVTELIDIGLTPDDEMLQRAGDIVADCTSTPLARLLAVSSYVFLASTVRVLSDGNGIL